MVPPTPNSSARCRVCSMTHLNAVMLELGNAHHGAANPRLFRSQSELIEMGRLIMVPPIPGSSARSRNLLKLTSVSAHAPGVVIPFITK